MTKRKPIAETSAEITRRVLMDIVRGKAQQHGVDPALACAVAEQESEWNPWAFRFEASFYRQYVAPLYTAEKLKADLTEMQARATSWGLFQVMGQVAREHDFAGRYLTELCQPDVGAEYGCLVLRQKLERERGDVVRALLAYNGSGRASYADEVLARKPSYE